MMSKPKYIVTLTGPFLQRSGRRASHFYSIFAVNVLARVDFWYDNYGLWPWQAKPRPKITNMAYDDSVISFMKVMLWVFTDTFSRCPCQCFRPTIVQYVIVGVAE